MLNLEFSRGRIICSALVLCTVQLPTNVTQDPTIEVNKGTLGGREFPEPFSQAVTKEKGVRCN
jgi:hypothetical protein